MSRNLQSLVIVLRLAFLCSGLLLSPALGQASLLKELHITSSPEGAEVYLKRGGKEIPLGQTPLSYQAKFHSEISILRLMVKKPHYEDLLLKVSPANEKVMANLTPLPPPSLVVNPTEHTDSTLARLQEVINPTLRPIVSSIWEQEKIDGLAIVSPLTLAKVNGENILRVSLTTGSNRKPLQGNKRQKKEAFHTLWAEIAERYLVPLAPIPRMEPRIKGILFEVSIGQLQHSLQVKPQVVQTTEMQCRAGFDPCLKYSNCAFFDAGGNCIAGNVQGQCFNVCKYRVPVVKSEVKINTEASVNSSKGRANFFVHEELLPLLNTGEIPLKEVKYSLLGSDGHPILSYPGAAQ